MHISNTRLEQYRRDGTLRIERAVPADTIQDLLEHIDQLIDSDQFRQYFDRKWK